MYPQLHGEPSSEVLDASTLSASPPPQSASASELPPAAGIGAAVGQREAQLAAKLAAMEEELASYRQQGTVPPAQAL